MKKELCEDGMEHDPIDCPNCHYQFCSHCYIGENDAQEDRRENVKETK